MNIQKVVNTEIIKLLNESVEYNKIKKYLNIIRNPVAQTYIDNVFKKLKNYNENTKTNKSGDRVYIPFSNNQNIEVVDMIKYSNIKNEITKILDDNGYKLKDYNTGTAIDKYNREISIGKALTKLNKQELIDKFNKDKTRIGAKGGENKKIYIVFSKHKYDIASMSTDRGWNSCMNIDRGTNKKYLNYDIKEGSIIAYAVYENDFNINNPIARITIKPFINIKNSNDMILIPEMMVYGNLTNFLDKVMEIMSDVQNNINLGEYKIQKNVYSDSWDDDTTFVLNKKKNADINNLSPNERAVYFNNLVHNKFKFNIVEKFNVYGDNIALSMLLNGIYLFIDDKGVIAPPNKINYDAVIKSKDPTIVAAYYNSVKNSDVYRSISYKEFNGVKLAVLKDGGYYLINNDGNLDLGKNIINEIPAGTVRSGYLNSKIGENKFSFVSDEILNTNKYLAKTTKQKTHVFINQDGKFELPDNINSINDIKRNKDDISDSLSLGDLVAAYFNTIKKQPALLSVGSFNKEGYANAKLWNGKIKTINKIGDFI